MFVTEGVYTRKVAKEVGSAIKYMVEHPEDDRFFDESEIVQCITRSGRRLDIIFGHAAERELQPALVLLGVET